MFCKKCGAQLADDAKFCPNCGEKFEEEQPVTGTVEETFTEKDKNDNKLMAILAYLSILVFVPIFAAKESKWARFHADQGFTLFLIGVVSFILGYIPVIRILSYVLNLGLFVFSILGIVNVCKNEAAELPYIGKYTFLDKIFPQK